ncbi:hypothetical protein FTUN_0527 [Frigoriglobus tundricola]|uniref:Uncharacterized protein n=1 Tax=Frigoriglobus tundricola TaxID=2774151 RepID=A0A6M5YG70_9BACT|nr:hypothetical protein FTUN_0527 [Frigoriglobus tundricola]
MAPSVRHAPAPGPAHTVFANAASGVPAPGRRAEILRVPRGAALRPRPTRTFLSRSIRDPII